MTSRSRTRTSLYEWLAIVSASLIVITLIFTFMFRFVDVDGTSMEPTLRNGERLILSSLPYTPKRGDIVVVSEGNEREPLIKRIIGLPGDTIRIDENTGDVYVNGKVLNEPYVSSPTSTEGMTGSVTVPEGMVFIMGDNRAPGCSRDSRSSNCYSQSAIVGKVIWRIAPTDRFGGLYD